MMNVKEESEKIVESLFEELGGDLAGYLFHIPDWEPQELEMGIRWLKSQIWEGFSVSYDVNKIQKTLQLKSWEEDFN